MLKNPDTEEIIYTPPDDPDTIQRLLSNFEFYANDTSHQVSLLIKMAILHYQFESIHPFYDGNGRTGRIINVLYLILHKLLDVPILYLSSYIIKHKRTYYQLFREVQTEEKWEAWVLFMLKGIEETAIRTVKQIEEINALFREIQLKVQKHLPRIYSKDLIEQLFINPYTKVAFLNKALGLERKASSRYLKSLVRVGILEEKVVGKEKLYINKKLYEILCGGTPMVL